MAEQSPMFETNLCYTAGDFRRETAGLVCVEGISGSGSLAVTSAGSGLGVSVAAGSAFIKGDDTTDQGMYWVFNDAPVVLTATTASPSNPRIDTVVATVRDSDFGGTDDDWVLQILPGTATPGATLTNLSGAAALPVDSIRLAYVLVPTSFTGPFVDATHILDVRTNFVSCATPAAAPYIELQASAATTGLVSGVATKVNLATTVHNDSRYFSVAASVITVREAGIYDFSGFASIVGTLTASTIQAVVIGAGGTANSVVQVLSAPGGNAFRASPSAGSYTVAAGATFQLNVFATGSALNTEHTAGTLIVSRLMIRKVG